MQDEASPRDQKDAVKEVKEGFTVHFTLYTLDSALYALRLTP
jgi:hypothetical protein